MVDSRPGKVMPRGSAYVCTLRLSGSASSSAHSMDARG